MPRNVHRIASILPGLLLASIVGCEDAAVSVHHEAMDASSSEVVLAPVRGAPSNDETVREQHVSIDNFTFHPEILEVPSGTKVIWTNRDDVPHTVRSTEDAFNSGALDTDDTWSRVFSATGSYTYYCGVHPHMSGKIVVK